MKTLVQYVRRGNKLIGCFAGVRREDGLVAIDYSLCRKTDEFSKKTAKDIAIGRAISPKTTAPDYDRCLPVSLRRKIRKFESRCVKYFKEPIGNISTFNGQPSGE